MKQAVKAGRNDPCPCGSGRKFKRCCEAKQTRGAGVSRVMLVVIGGLIAGAVILGMISLETDRGTTTTNRVWSAEHGHYH